MDDLVALGTRGLLVGKIFKTEFDRTIGAAKRNRHGNKVAFVYLPFFILDSQWRSF